MGLLRGAIAHIECRRDPLGFHRRRGVRFGVGVELLDANPHMFGSEPYLIEIGDGVTISQGVRFITHDGGFRVVRHEHPGAFYYAPIRIGPGAFIGAHSILLPGAVVGERTVVGAGAVVTGELPSGYVCAGVPARPIRSVEEYAEARRDEWIDTRGLSADQKRARLESQLRPAQPAADSPPPLPR